MNSKIRRALTALALTAALSALACGSSAGSKTSDPAPEPTAHATPNDFPPPTTVINDPASTPTVAPTKAPDKPIDNPTTLPRLEWIRTSHAGPGVVTIRFLTNVPTTADVRVSQGEVGPASIYEEHLGDLAKEHETSVPANAMGRYVVHVKDKAGRDAWGTLRLTDQYGLDWANQLGTPTLTVPDSKHLILNWGFPSNHPSHMGLDGELFVFATSAKCTTADSCAGSQVADIDAPSDDGVKFESHTATATIAGTANDYQMIIAQPLNADGSSMIFREIEVRGSQLPKDS
jgi:hypothetical protein